MRQERLQVNLLPEHFTVDMMHYLLQHYHASLEPITSDVIKSPEAFKDKGKWRDFSKSFLTYMQRTIGRCDFPLSYILRENEDGQGLDIADFDSIVTYEEAIVPFSGPDFDLDNNAVFDSLKSYVLGGPHWTWIQDYERTRDGRAAWKALSEHFDGPSGLIRLKAAYAAIKRAEYKGSKNFDYEFY